MKYDVCYFVQVAYCKPDDHEAQAVEMLEKDAEEYIKKFRAQGYRAYNAGKTGKYMYMLHKEA